MHQETALTSQLGWNPELPSFYATKLENFIKKKGGKYTKGGVTIPKPT